jgi:hypothetical protein
MDQAHALIDPVLSQRTPFPMLRRIGEVVGQGSIEGVTAFNDLLASEGKMGAWVVIGSALEAQLDRDFRGVFSRCRGYIVLADVWNAADTLGEQIPGRSLVAQFEPTLEVLEAWRRDADAWVRRALGAGVHYWAKRSRGDPQHLPQADRLLDFLESTFEEREVNAVKGIGWGLKTLGRQYPRLLADWLERQQIQHGRRPSALMLRKALTYLPEELRVRACGEATR